MTDDSDNEIIDPVTDNPDPEILGRCKRESEE